jgi:lipopolysaccharide biosynthesis glycosyltransferase
MNSAVCTLATGPLGFLHGAMAQKIALEKVHPELEHIVIVERDAYQPAYLSEVVRLGSKVLAVPSIRPPKKVKYVTSRWKFTFTKLHIWSLIDYDTLVFLDADCIPLQPFFSQVTDFQDKDLVAAPVKFNTPGRFNSGVMGLRPSTDEYNALIERMNSMPESLKLSDQGLLNDHFIGRLRQISLRYNMRTWSARSHNCAIAHLRPKPWGSRVPYRGILGQAYTYWKQCFQEARARIR